MFFALKEVIRLHVTIFFFQIRCIAKNPQFLRNSVAKVDFFVHSDEPSNLISRAGRVLVTPSVTGIQRIYYQVQRILLKLGVCSLK